MGGYPPLAFFQKGCIMEYTVKVMGAHMVASKNMKHDWQPVEVGEELMVELACVDEKGLPMGGCSMQILVPMGEVLDFTVGSEHRVDISLTRRKS